MPITDASPVALAGVMADSLSEMVDTLVGIDAAIAGLTAARTELLESMRVWSELAESAAPHSTPASRDLAFRSLRAEVACALRLPERSVERLFGEARMLVQDLPRTMTALRAGEIGYRHAQVIVVQGSGLSAGDLDTSSDGYGPIAISTARELAAHAPSFVRILTHPETGAILSVGRDRYPVPRDLRTVLRVRDGTCGFVSCSRDAAFCDIDHTVDWARDGTTSLGNLAFLCRGHHTLKHHSGWSVRQAEHGVLNWTSPAGRNYQSRPSGPRVV